MKKKISNIDTVYTAVLRPKYLGKLNHGWPIVNPSPWPFLLSIKSFIFFSSLAIILHGIGDTSNTYYLLGAMLGIVGIIFMWARDLFFDSVIYGR